MFLTPGQRVCLNPINILVPEKHLIKSRKSGTKTRKMSKRLKVYSFKRIRDSDSEWFIPIFEYRIVNAKSREGARKYIDDNGNFELVGNIRGVAYGEEGYEDGHIEVKCEHNITFYRNIKKIGIAPEGAIEGIVDLEDEDNLDENDK